jgi:hypothetical protein
MGEMEGVMPRELFRGLDADNKAVSMDLSLGWGRGLAEVQVGLVMPEPRTDEDPRTIYEMIQRWHPQDREQFDSLWFTCRSWSQANRIIAKMRDARNSTFGRPA